VRRYTAPGGTQVRVRATTGRYSDTRTPANRPAPRSASRPVDGPPAGGSPRSAPPPFTPERPAKSGPTRVGLPSPVGQQQQGARRDDRESRVVIVSRPVHVGRPSSGDYPQVDPGLYSYQSKDGSDEMRLDTEVISDRSLDKVILDYLEDQDDD
jgi:hypothetical protein